MPFRHSWSHRHKRERASDPKFRYASTRARGLSRINSTAGLHCSTKPHPGWTAADILQAREARPQRFSLSQAAVTFCRRQVGAGSTCEAARTLGGVHFDTGAGRVDSISPKSGRESQGMNQITPSTSICGRVLVSPRAYSTPAPISAGMALERNMRKSSRPMPY